VDELLHHIDTPLYLGDIDNNDQLKIYTRVNSLSVQLPAVLPSKETNRARTLCYDIMREKTNNDSVHYFMENTARIWPNVLKAFITPFLKEILQYLSEILNSEEFHNKCCNEYDQEKFQEYRFNLVKSFELAACWWCWDDVHSRYVSKILWPLVKNEKGKDIPLEIIGAVCRPRLFEKTEKE
ncbi:11105_t:CDS:2, partial [Racocetra fulgida]